MPCPTVSLLATCSLIYTEVSPIAYSRNTFVLPISPLTVKFFENALRNQMRQSWVKAVMLEFSAYDMGFSCRDAEWKTHLALLGTNPNRIDDRFRRMDLMKKGDDEAFKRQLACVSRRRKANLVQDLLALDYLEVDFSRTRCQHRCCVV